MDMQSISVDTERLTLAGFHNGITKGRPVIALHGWLDNAASFSNICDHLALDRPFYAMELPGHGLSDHRPKSCSYQLLENIVDIAALVGALSPNDEPVTLVGHSLGGIICSLYCASSPERVDRLVLLDSLGPMTDEVSSVLPQLRKAM
jgi:pimeloyl-ACP methyl ester carboxylesterase